MGSLPPKAIALIALIVLVAFLRWDAAEDRDRQRELEAGREFIDTTQEILDATSDLPTDPDAVLDGLRDHAD